MTRLVGFGVAAAFYLLLIDTTDLPELYAGGIVAVLATLAFWLSREQGFPEVRVLPGWLRGGWRLAVRVPLDIAAVCVAAVRQVRRREHTRGGFRTVAFNCDDDESLAAGRRALAEALGSLPPNTIVIGVDEQRGLLLAHQLDRGGGRDTVDLLRLG
jgi:multisubunit Na+/H+ antiporter MnhE subunit